MDCISGLPEISEIILLHVLDTTNIFSSSTWGTQEEHARVLLKNDMAVFATMVPHVSSCLEVGHSGNISGCISQVAEREKVDLLVMSAGSMGYIKGLHLGSVTFALIHDSPVNQLIMRHRVIEDLHGDRYEKFCPLILSKVLIPVDLSPHSLEAVRILSEIPGIGKIILIHVIPWDSNSKVVDARLSQAFIIIEQFCGELRKKGVETQGDVLIGDPVPTIIRYADEEDVSVICVVPVKKSRVMEMIHGSFTCDLAGKTTRPVLILKDLI